MKIHASGFVFKKKKIAVLNDDLLGNIGHNSVLPLFSWMFYRKKMLRRTVKTLNYD